MKKLAAVVVALVAAVGAGSIATAAPDKVKVKSKLKANVSTSGVGPYATATFSGKVNAKIGNKKSKKACRKRRTVKVSGGLGKTKTSKKGRFSITVASPPSGTYAVKAKKKKARAAGNRLVCKKARKTVTVP
ncbi:MAG: hypothetical protein ACRDK9_11245 [Solirubrobacterales bacterium]